MLVVIGRAPPIYRDGADAVARRYDVDLASDDTARGGAKLDHGNLYSAEVSGPDSARLRSEPLG